jgi:hypothetical protein
MTRSAIGLLPTIMRQVVFGIALIASCQTLQAQEISKAEKMLFLENHFKNVSPPETLEYDYVQTGTEGKGFMDVVFLDVKKKNNDGSVVLSSQFLTDDRKVPIPEAEQFEGNPAIQGFLERDINEMKRLTGGSTSYFRKRIRLALAESAKVEPVTVSYKGNDFAGQRITIEPYLDDPMKDKFRQYVGKKYTFVLSEKVPGSVFEIKSSIPTSGASVDKENSESKLIEETMTLSS